MNKKSNIKRLLCIVSSMNAGGAETFLMKLYRVLDKNKYQMDFYCMSTEKSYYEDEIINLGGRIFRATPKSANFLKSFFELKQVIKENNYKYVMRVSQHSLATFDLLAAKLGGAQVLIQRSSNADSESNLSRILHFLFKWLPMTIPNVKIAPSTEAAEYTFGKKCIDKKKAVIVKNAIPVDRFIFNEQARKKIRDELNLETNFVIGHVGRFSKQKNHSFLIDMFNEIMQRHENSVMLLVGKGELENEIKNKIKKLGLSNKVIFTGVRSDIPEIMMAMDAFVFPSFYEGMPNTIIEAQATGLPCIVSDTITYEANITGLVDYLPLECNADEWAYKALEYRNDYERENMTDLFKENKYEINSVVKEFVKFIFKD